MRAFWFLALFMGTLGACDKVEKAPPPNLEKYKEDTTLMLKVVNKFVDEPDVNRLHKVAVATQQTRVLACADYNNECNLYGEIMTTIIGASSDGTISPQERQEMKKQLAKLKLAVDEGVRKLQRGEN